MALDPAKLKEWKTALAEISAARKRGGGRWAPGQERAAEAAAYLLAEEATPSLIAEVERLQARPRGIGDGDIIAALAERDRLRALLREVEWSRPGGAGGCLDLCPVCHGRKPYEVRGLPVDGHTPGCHLAAALKEG